MVGSRIDISTNIWLLKENHLIVRVNKLLLSTCHAPVIVIVADDKVMNVSYFQEASSLVGENSTDMHSDTQNTIGIFHSRGIFKAGFRVLVPGKPGFIPYCFFRKQGPWLDNYINYQFSPVKRLNSAVS